MAVARVLANDGKIRGEHRQGETYSRDYLHDALGSVVAMFQNGNQVAEGVYKPYGYRDGEWQMDSYKFSWNGGWGYRRTGMGLASNYVRARHYAQFSGGWNTVDPLWPNEMPYGYVEGRAMVSTDYRGTSNCHEFTMKLPKWSALKVTVCPRTVHVGNIVYFDPYGYPCSNPGLKIAPIHIPCVDVFSRVFIHGGDKNRYGQGSSVATIALCSKLKDPKAITACSAFVPLLWLLADNCAKKNGDVCIEQFQSTCPDKLSAPPPGCCAGFG